MSLLDILYVVTGYTRIRYIIDKPIVDNLVFQAHYIITSGLMLICSALITATHLIGSPIDCISDYVIPPYVINAYCWMANTFTLPNEDEKNLQVAHPGLGNENEEKHYHNYYQWVPFVLFFQAILFYLPHWIWKNYEGNKVYWISDGLRGAVVERNQDTDKRKSHLVRYLVKSLGLHNFYAIAYFSCEVLNFFNVLLNIFATDRFLGGAFLEYGFNVISFSSMNQESRTDPMIQTFPRVTKCSFFKYGVTGTIQKYDAMCLLASNVLNEKIYIFLWFWFIILAVLSGIGLVYTAVVIITPRTRTAILKRRFRFAMPDGVQTIVNKTQVGDFLLLHFLSQNIEPPLYEEILNEFVTRLKHASGSNESLAASTINSIDSDIETPATKTD